DGLADLGEDLLGHVLRVLVAQALAAAMAIDEPAVDLHKGLPGLDVARVADTQQQARPRGRPGGVHGHRYIPHEMANLAAFSPGKEVPATEFRAAFFPVGRRARLAWELPISVCTTRTSESRAGE